MAVLLKPDDAGIAEAVRRLSSGELVVIPTETVYGLAGNALDPRAVASIFKLKGRPSTNPVIVHIASYEQVDEIATGNEQSRLLDAAFWPGPLTIVLPARTNVPTLVTAGGQTVGIRIPNHSVALKLLKSSQLPLAAPSANKSQGISPTTPELVMRSFIGSAPLILDGGRCEIGIESTVIDVTGKTPRILRPGAITRTQIEAVLGRSVVFGNDDHFARSPGQMALHYAPNTLALLSRDPWSDVEAWGVRAACLHYSESPASSKSERHIKLPDDPAGYAAGLYLALSQLDDSGVVRIVIEEPPESEDWAAVRDRLTRATGPRR